MDEKKRKDEMIKRRKIRQRNRKYLFYTTVFIAINIFTYSYYGKTEKLKEEKQNIINSEIFSVNRSFLDRKELFYKDEEYLKNHTFLKKEWEREYKGVKFYGKSED